MATNHENGGDGCPDCAGTGWYGDNGPGVRGNGETMTMTLDFAESADRAESPGPLDSVVGACQTCRHARTRRGDGSVPYIAHGFGFCGKGEFYGEFLPRAEPRMDLPGNDCWEGPNTGLHLRQGGDHESTLRGFEP